MNRHQFLLGVSFVLAMAGQAKADFSYDYIEADYQYVEMDTFDVFLQPLSLTADGYGIDFSHDYENNIMVVGGYERLDFDDVAGFSSTQSLFRIGAGYHHSFNEFYDVYGTLSYVGIETDVVGGSITDDGFELVGGLRVWPSKVFELSGFVQYSGYDDPIEQTLSELSLTGQARWHINETLSLGMGASVGENTNSYFGNLRLTFGSLPFGL